MKRLRNDRRKLHLICIARLVEKKGLDHQLRIYSALARAGVAFEARIIGEGPLRAQLEAQAGSAGIGAQVTFTGHLAQQDVWAQLDWADALLHTGVVAPSGDRDGLPNVIPEAMSVGVVVLTSPTAATTEAISDRETGFVAAVDQPGEWVSLLKTFQSDQALAEKLRLNARRWVEQNFDAHKNAARLVTHFRKHMPAFNWQAASAERSCGERGGPNGTALSMSA
jgi:glycosyltransferase involved in cell wall biosynthesis